MGTDLQVILLLWKCYQIKADDPYHKTYPSFRSGGGATSTRDTRYPHLLGSKGHDFAGLSSGLGIYINTINIWSSVSVRQ